ncbi:hypothetical protein [Streptomyces graminilatus]|uniref:hypothetical protein n=1 Tax=Streptomyces graminilatus TaxID=1464070 RepID=UPI0012FF2C64|nr:hypothetical protein [Streptomyces graminilatus]
MDDELEVRHAAWALYVSLHLLAESHTGGQIHTDVQRGTLSDLDDALDQLDQTQAMLSRSHPDLVQGIRSTVASWEEHPTDRLVRLLPLLDDLAEIAGASLPSLLPPST